MKILINSEYSGLDFSYEALCRYKELSGAEMVHFSYIEDIGNHLKYVEYVDEAMEDFLPVVLKTPDDPDDMQWITDDSWGIKRDDKYLIQMFEEFGERISNERLYNRLKIIEIPDNANWHIDSQDWGGETLVVKTVKINREKLEGLYGVDEISDFLENNPDVIEFKEEYFN